MKILVVDDNETDLYMLETLLKGNGYHVITATNGVEALEKARQEKPDMIISDILMPKMDGFQLCRELKKDEELKDIPVLFYSATYTNEGSRKLALGIGAVDYIIKPMEPDEFIKIVKKVLDEYGKGELKPTEKPLEEKVYMKLYNERLIQKLEKKMLDLEKSEKYIRHLNGVLRAIGSVNQLIVRENDRDVLLQKACDILIEARGYSATWLGFLKDNKNFATVAGSGLREDISRFYDHVMRGDHPPCIKKALAQKDLVMVVDKTKECRDCFFKNAYPRKETVIIRIENGDKLFGLLAISLASDVAVDSEEKGLLKEVANDIALALHNIELEEKRKQAEEALRESERKFRNLIESVPLGVSISTSRGNVSDVNPAIWKIFGYDSKEEFVEVSGEDYCYNPKDRERFVELHKKGVVKGFETRFKRKDGTVFWGSVTSTTRTTESGATEFINVFEDITNRKRLEQQREKSKKEAEFYADVLGHDVGNLDQITMGYLYLLQIAKDEETRKKNINGIKRSIMKSKRLAESIKTLKIIKDTKIEKFDLNESIERSIKNIKEYSDKEIEVKLDIDKHYYVKANDFLDKVFFNILENSVEFIFQDKVIIDIKTEEKNDFCNVHIHDNGIGISKEKREDILENLETLSKRTGMGFYLTKKILERFNGKFEIKDVKKGTEIVVSIPVINGGSARNVHAQRSHKRNEQEGRR